MSLKKIVNWKWWLIYLAEMPLSTMFHLFSWKGLGSSILISPKRWSVQCIILHTFLSSYTPVINNSLDLDKLLIFSLSPSGGLNFHFSSRVSRVLFKFIFLMRFWSITPLSTRNHHSKSVEFGSNSTYFSIDEKMLWC